MPTYLIHGFRWSRPLIRIHIASHNLDDCCAEWLVAPVSIRTLLNNFYTNYDFLPPCQQPTPHSSHPSSNNSTASLGTITPTGSGGKGSVSASRTLKREGVDDGTQLTGFNAWSPVKVLEQHSEKSLVVSHPHAYIGDYVLPITLSADIAQEMMAYDQRARTKRERLERETRDALDGFAPTSDTPPTEENGQRKRKGPPVAMKSNGVIGTSSNGTGSGSSTPSRRPSISRLRRQERQLDWISQLRDKLQPSAEMGWYVVVVDDEERKLDEDYEPFEPEYIEIFPSKVSAEKKGSRAGSPQAGPETFSGADAEGARTGGVDSALSSRSRNETELVDKGDASRHALGKRRNSVARLRGLFGLKEKQRQEKEFKWEGAAEWEKMQRKQREQADSSSVKQPFPPGWEKTDRKGNEGPLSNFSRPGTGNTEKGGYVERPGTATGRLSKLRK